jgi:hypothetical protein
MENLIVKLDNVRKEIGKVVKDSENPFFKSKYTDINSLIEQLEPILEKHKLVLLQPIRKDMVFSEIHDIENGEKITSSLRLPDLTDPQKIGSAVTYYRRYTLTSLLALQSEDDDGNLASGKVYKPKEGKEVERYSSTKPKAQAKESAQGQPDLATDKQINYIKALGGKVEDILTKQEANDIIKKLKGE